MGQQMVKQEATETVRIEIKTIVTIKRTTADATKKTACCCGNNGKR